jgi:hypothetical protein
LFVQPAVLYVIDQDGGKKNETKCLKKGHMMFISKLKPEEEKIKSIL